MKVAALYIDPRGPYPSIEGVDCWDEERDARLYAGPWPVVAHPSCGPWGRYRHLKNCRQDPGCGVVAVEQVRLWGGVLEHPEGSALWRHCEMPLPGELPDRWGGWTLSIDQVRWGHGAVKPTWVYIVGGSFEDLPPAPPGPAEPKTTIEAMSRLARRLTPPAMADWFVTVASRCKRKNKVRKKR